MPNEFSNDCWFCRAGSMWPLEAMHPFLKKFSVFVPLTLSVESFRSMTSRNWGIFHPTVNRGFISILTWIGVAILISMLSLRLKQGIKAQK